LTVATGVYEAEGAKLGKMLRERRLAELNFVGKDTDRQFASDQVVHDEEPFWVPHQFEKLGGSFAVVGKSL
jgi:hypothetical protein